MHGYGVAIDINVRESNHWLQIDVKENTENIQYYRMLDVIDLFWGRKFTIE
ncbi:hypothetical protein GHK47_02750 [Sinorhizobium meliloti]|uniref:M15 family metallopeptidase n=1 Tax=Rhizobium meliloti TaxID=382 RepID=UPI00135EE681|nr:hypothetical protein [Sinorhizobium meliloti]